MRSCLHFSLEGSLWAAETSPIYFVYLHLSREAL